MSKVRTTHTSTRSITTETTKADIAKWLEAIPDDAKIRVITHQGDRYWESDTHEIKATWSEEL